MNNLYLTYETNFHIDGFGAQYQRIVGIFCLSRIIGSKYVHTPIDRYEHLPLEYCKKIEDHFGLEIFKSGKTTKQNGIELTIPENFDNEIRNLEPMTLDELKIMDENKTTLIKIGFAMQIFDKNPDLQNTGMDELRSLKKKIDLPEFEKDKKNIAIHIRRGDVAKDSYYHNRFTDNEIYLKIIDKMQKKYDNCNICIFTQGSEGFDEFRQIDGVKILNDLDILVTFEYMCNADVLFIAKSSLSYMAGLYNTSSEIYIEKSFWHTKLSRWKYIDDFIQEDKLNDKVLESYSNYNNANEYYDYLSILIFIIIFFIYYTIFNIKKIKNILKNFYKAIGYRTLLFSK
jgi:hypothetical protein